METLPDRAIHALRQQINRAVHVPYEKKNALHVELLPSPTEQSFRRFKVTYANWASNIAVRLDVGSYFAFIVNFASVKVRT